jgi:hypothetical protein
LCHIQRRCSSGGEVTATATTAAVTTVTVTAAVTALISTY